MLVNGSLQLLSQSRSLSFIPATNNCFGEVANSLFEGHDVVARTGCERDYVIPGRTCESGDFLNGPTDLTCRPWAQAMTRASRALGSEVRPQSR